MDNPRENAKNELREILQDFNFEIKIKMLELQIDFYKELLNGNKKICNEYLNYESYG
jgi:hypothetical protein